MYGSFYWCLLLSYSLQVSVDVPTPCSFSLTKSQRQQWWDNTSMWCFAATQATWAWNRWRWDHTRSSLPKHWLLLQKITMTASRLCPLGGDRFSLRDLGLLQESSLSSPLKTQVLFCVPPASWKESVKAVYVCKGFHMPQSGYLNWFSQAIECVGLRRALGCV